MLGLHAQQGHLMLGEAERICDDTPIVERQRRGGLAVDDGHQDAPLERRRVVERGESAKRGRIGIGGKT
jgi:hypothetical protein